MNLVEASIYLNLVILSAATSSGLNSAALVYSLVGIVFATTIGIIVYHFHILYTAKSAMWLKMKTMLSGLKTKVRKSDTISVSVETPVATSEGDPRQKATTTVLELREPLLT